MWMTNPILTNTFDQSSNVFESLTFSLWFGCVHTLVWLNHLMLLMPQSEHWSTLKIKNNKWGISEFVPTFRFWRFSQPADCRVHHGRGQQGKRRETGNFDIHTNNLSHQIWTMKTPQRKPQCARGNRKAQPPPPPPPPPNPIRTWPLAYEARVQTATPLSSSSHMSIEYRCAREDLLSSLQRFKSQKRDGFAPLEIIPDEQTTHLNQVRYTSLQQFLFNMFYIYFDQCWSKCIILWRPSMKTLNCCKSS